MVSEQMNIERAAIFLRQKLSALELAGKISEQEALKLIAALTEIERVLS